MIHRQSWHRNSPCWCLMVVITVKEVFAWCFFGSYIPLVSLTGKSSYMLKDLGCSDMRWRYLL